LTRNLKQQPDLKLANNKTIQTNQLSKPPKANKNLKQNPKPDAKIEAFWAANKL